MLVEKGADLQVVWNVVQRNLFFFPPLSLFFFLLQCVCQISLSACPVCCVLLSVSQVKTEKNITTVVIVVACYIT